MLRPVTSGWVCPRPGLKVPQVAFALSRLPPGKKDKWDREVLATHVLLQAGGAWAIHTRVQWGSGSPDRPWPLSFTVIPARAALLHSSLPDPASQPKARLSPQGGPCRLERTSSSETGNSHSPTQCHIRTELRCLKSFLQLLPSPCITVERPRPAQVTSTVLGHFAQGPAPLSPQMGKNTCASEENRSHLAEVRPPSASWCPDGT